jgi:hypothetical protein
MLAARTRQAASRARQADKEAGQGKAGRQDMAGC